MEREVSGQIHNVSNDFRIISIQIIEKLEFFYLQPRFVKQFRKYLYPGVFLNFTTNLEKFKMKRRLVSKVISFNKIIGNRYHRKFSYFDQNITKNKIIEKLKEHDYRLFLDLEMTMQRTKKEVEEIIQAGAILVDRHDHVILEYNKFIKPTVIDNISIKIFDFLNIDSTKIMNGIHYREFYDNLKKISETYNPAVIVWGNNDIHALERSYHLNKLSPILNTKNFINLQQVHKEYYNMNYELGLFNTAKIYQLKCGEQSHDAFDDAFITRLIFNKFYENAINDYEYDFKQAMLDIHII
ncbi:MAG: sporulation inhibitor KapD [Haloplasmataceae bacterium]|nr:sporulation inhibitor KapD [Haloplasmataceae bacterium]